MDSKIKYMLLKTVQDKNILPITSVCNMNCQFCSHLFNPPEVEVFSFGHLKIGLIKELLDYVSPDTPIVIGESATKIIEGDPFTHPQFIQILKIIRSRFPEKIIKITTNGSYLTEEIISFLEKIEPVRLNISLNCASPEERVFLMGDKKSEIVFAGLKLLDESSIIFSGSLVAVPHLIGWDSIEQTIKLLADYHPDSIRVFMPGFSKYASEKLKFDIVDMYSRLKKLTSRLNTELSLPIILEPPELENTACLINNIIKKSPTAEAGLTKGDIIVAVNGNKINSRVEGFNKVLTAENPELLIRRKVQFRQKSKAIRAETERKQQVMKDDLQNVKEHKIKLQKAKGEKPGFIVDYDLDRQSMDTLRSIILKNNQYKIGVITSRLAEDMIKDVIENIQRDLDYNINIDVFAVKNNLFGGSIMAAGLLVVDDIINKMKKLHKKYDLIILPRIIFDIFGNDLTGNNYKKIEKKLNLNVHLV
ncbi:MAG: DUF512 domain-containing protein [Halothermotrichaceae bacterium]